MPPQGYCILSLCLILSFLRVDKRSLSIKETLLVLKSHRFIYPGQLWALPRTELSAPGPELHVSRPSSPPTPIPLLTLSLSLVTVAHIQAETIMYPKRQVRVRTFPSFKSPDDWIIASV